MAVGTKHFPPTSRPDARFDAVVARGEQIRRRERTRRAAVTGTAAAAVILVALAVSALSAGRDTDRSPATRPDGATTATTTGPTTTVAPPERLTVHPSTTDGVVDVVVSDTRFPISDSAKICVRIRTQPEGPARTAVSAYESCWTPADGDGPTVAQVPIVSAEVGCAATADQPGEPPTTTLPPGTTSARHLFRFVLPAGLPAGDHVAELTAVSGTGDGCETSNPADDDVAATASIGFTVR